MAASRETDFGLVVGSVVPRFGDGGQGAGALPIPAMRLRGGIYLVMPGLVPGIHVLAVGR
jgi:hypothetical protein